MTSFLWEVLIIALIIIFQLASKKKFNLRKIKWPTKEPTKTRSKTRTETSNLTYILLYCDTSELGLFLLVLDPTSVFSELLSLSITNFKKKEKNQLPIFTRVWKKPQSGRSGDLDTWILISVLLPVSWKSWRIYLTCLPCICLFQKATCFTE